MTVYAVAQLRFTDEPAYRRYQAGFPATLRGHQGVLLAADENPTVIEGDWRGDKIVLMAFPDEASYRAWADSPAYQRIAVDRRAGAETIALLVKGLAAPGLRRPA
jgi:uncharacterized protein (DUF1330 family)